MLWGGGGGVAGSGRWCCWEGEVVLLGGGDSVMGRGGGVAGRGRWCCGEGEVIFWVYILKRILLIYIMLIYFYFYSCHASLQLVYSGPQSEIFYRKIRYMFSYKVNPVIKQAMNYAHAKCHQIMPGQKRVFF